MRPTIPEVVPLIRAYYAKPGNELGGKLHVVLDDGNTSRDHVGVARHHAWEDGDEDAIELCDLLLSMTGSQRRRLSYMTFYPW